MMEQQQPAAAGPMSVAACLAWKPRAWPAESRFIGFSPSPLLLDDREKEGGEKE